MSLDKVFEKIVKCCECGRSRNTLLRVKDEKGEKIKPAKYICVNCNKK